MSEHDILCNKSAILVGNKSDLARSRVLTSGDGCDLAIEHGLKFTETSPGMGHHIDELLVGIVMQLRLHEKRDKVPITEGHQMSLKQSLRSFLSIFTGREDEKRKACKNLNIWQTVKINWLWWGKIWVNQWSNICWISEKYILYTIRQVISHTIKYMQSLSK